MPDDLPPRGVGVWSFPRQLGSDGAFSLVGSVPVAILAGFALTTAVQMADRPTHSGVDQVSVAALSIGVVCFLVTLELVLSAAQYLASPDTRLSYQPEARLDPDALRRVRERQWEDAALLAHYAQRINSWYVNALVATLIGFGAAVLASDVNAGTVVAYTAVSALVLMELINSRGARPLPKRLFKLPDDFKGSTGMPELDALSAAAVGDSLSEPWLLQTGVRRAGELQAAADAGASGELYRECTALLMQRCDGWYTTPQSFVATAVTDGTHARVLEVHPFPQREDGGLCISVAISSTAAWLGISEADLVERLAPRIASGPALREPRAYPIAVDTSSELSEIIATTSA